LEKFELEKQKTPKNIEICKMIFPLKLNGEIGVTVENLFADLALTRMFAPYQSFDNKMRQSLI
jgi:hypothetical protein